MCDPKRNLRPVKTCWCCDPQRHLRPKKIFATCKTFLVRTERTLIPCAELLRRGVHVRDFLFLIMLFYASILAYHFFNTCIFYVFSCFCFLYIGHAGLKRVATGFTGHKPFSGAAGAVFWKANCDRSGFPESSFGNTRKCLRPIKDIHDLYKTFPTCERHLRLIKASQIILFQEQIE